MKLLVKWAVMVALSLLLVSIWVKWDLDPFIIYTIMFLVIVACFVLTVYLFSLSFRGAFKQNKVLDKTMAETLSAALGSESSSLFTEIYAYILRLNKSTYNSPCFLGLTNSRLLMVQDSVSANILLYYVKIGKSFYNQENFVTVSHTMRYVL